MIVSNSWYKWYVEHQICDIEMIHNNTENIKLSPQHGGVSSDDTNYLRRRTCYKSAWTRGSYKKLVINDFPYMEKISFLDYKDTYLLYIFLHILMRKFR